MDNIQKAKSNAILNYNYDELMNEAKEYAGSEWDNLTKSEKEDLIEEMKSNRVEHISRMDEGGEADSEREDEEMEEANERLEELMEEYDLPREVIEEYASNMGVEIDDITDLPFSGRYDSEEDFAEDLVEQGAISNLSYYLEMTSLDMRLLAQEEADARVDNMTDDELLEAMDMEDEANEYNELKDEIYDLESDVDDLKSKLDDYLDEEDLTEGEMEMREEKAKELRDEIDEKESDLENLQDKLASLDTYDEVVDKAREQLRDVYYDDIHDELERDAVGYFVDNLGYAEEDLADNNLFRVDYEKLARDLSYDYTIIEHGGDVYVFGTYMDGGMTYAKGGNLPTIEKRVAEVNALIKEGNDKGVEVIDESVTWQSPMKYNQLKYSNGVLYISHKVLDLYKYRKSGGRDSLWEKQNYRIGKNESGMSMSNNSAQKEALTEIARMYRKALNHFNKYGWYGDGGYMAKGGMTEHGLKNGDKIIGGKIIGTTIRVHNDSLNEDARIDLNTGERTVLTYNQKTKKWEDKMADGGGIKGVYEGSVRRINGKDYLINESVLDKNGDIVGWNAYEVVYENKMGEKHINYERTKKNYNQKYFENNVALLGDDVGYEYFSNGGQTKIKKVRTLKEAKKDPRVEDIYFEEEWQKSGSWWLELKEGYICRSMGSGTIHEDTLKEVLDLLNTDVVKESEYADGGYMAKGGIADKSIDKFFVGDEKTNFGYVIKVNKKDRGLSTISYHKTKAEANKERDRLNKDSGMMAKGGVTFDDKVNAIKKRLEGMSVAPKFRKEYGKTYDKTEALSAAKKIAGKMKAKEMSKKKS